MTDGGDRNSSMRFRLAFLNGLSYLSAMVMLFVIPAALIRWMLPYSVVRTALDQQAGDGSADLYTLALHQRVVAGISLATSGGLLTLFLLAVYWRPVSKNMRELASEASQAIRNQAISLRESWPALTITGLVAALTRWPFIHLPMRFDESYTYLQYASQPLYVTVSKYDAPNNHVLHSVLVWFATRLGGNSPEVIRCPAFVCGVLTAMLAAWWGSRRGGRWVGVVAGCVAAMSSILVEYSVNARGYTLVQLLVMLIGVVGDEWVQRPTRAGLYFLSVLAALALWTMPTAVYPLVVMGVYLWGASRTASLESARASLLRELLVPGAVMIGLTLLLYSPLLVVSGLGAITSAGHGQFDGLGSWSRGFAASLVETFTLLDRDQPLPTLVLLVVGIAGSSRFRRAGLWIGLGLVACLVIVAIQRVAPPPRSWLFLWPFLCSLGVAGCDDSVREGSQRLRVAILVGVFVIGGVLPGVELFRSGCIARSPETGICPDAEAVITGLRSHLDPGEPIIAITPASAPLAYYAHRQSLPADHFFRPALATATTRRAILVLSRHPDQSIPEVLQALDLTEAYSRHRPQLRQEFATAAVYELIPPDEK